MQLSKILLLAFGLSFNLYAQDVKITGTLEQSVKVPSVQGIKSQNNNRIIKLLKVDLSKNGIKVIGARAQSVNNKASLAVTSTTSNLPRKVNLGMNGVPVLDQGHFGTCVTFATTAALNAALNKGDYISQVCELQLGTYLAENGYNPSGWDGSIGRFVLSQIDNFGVVSKENQKASGCGGLTEYPANPKEFSLQRPMSVEEFHAISENLNEQVTWSPILDIFVALDRVDTDKTVHEVKVALNKKDRVTFAVLLLDFDLGFMGAVGNHKTQSDTWVLTPEIARDIYMRPEFGGHEMIITGYDDDAVAVDEQGRQHRGLFTLRNSWGNRLGDKGNFYMSYDYFKVLVVEAQRIRTIDADGGLDSARA